MKVFVIGSKSGLEPVKAKILDRFCHKLGSQLAGADHQIILCSEQSTSVDYQILQGMASTRKGKNVQKLIVHRPDDDLIRKGWRKLEHEIELVEPVYNSHIGPVFRDEHGGIASREGLRMAFLLCQMSALKECDVVVTVGGRTDGPASVMLAIAREQRVPVLPFRFLGGAAEKLYNQLEGDLRRCLKNDIEKLSDEYQGAAAILSMIEALRTPTNVVSPRIFLSYSWKRNDYADLVEAILRRRGDVFVFRDENEIRSGQSILQKIRYELEEQCNMFMAIWGREYVESPNCYDEMQFWYDNNGIDQLYLLRFDDTRPVWPFLRKSPNDMNEFTRKWPVVDLSKQRPVIEKELGEFIDRITTSVAN